jgi:hypothetical protein
MFDSRHSESRAYEHIDTLLLPEFEEISLHSEMHIEEAE